MKIIILAALISSFSMSSIASVQSVYERLLKATGERRLSISVKKNVLSWCSLACTDGNRIIVSYELTQLVDNDDELAVVIGHEMGHRYYSSELMADTLGLEYAERAGYDRCKGAQFMKGYVADKKHPSGAIRYKNSGCL